MPYLDYQSVIEQARKENTDLSSKFPDDDGLYEFIYKRVDPKVWTGNPDAEFEPPENVYESRREQQEKAQIKQKQDSNTGNTIVTEDPKRWLLEGNIAGALGDLFDSNYLRYAATQGTADLSRMILTGKSGYQLKQADGTVISPEEYAENLNVVQEVGAWILGQGNVADLAIWGLSGGVGKIFTTSGTKALGKKIVATKLSPGATTTFQKRWANSNVQKFATNQRAKNTPYSNWIADWVEGSPATMASIGSFSAAAGTLHSAVNQRKTNVDGKSAYNPETGAFEGSVDVSKVIVDGMYEGIKGTMLGGLTAGVAPALSGPIANTTQKLSKSNSNFAQRAGQLMARFPKTTAGAASVIPEGVIFGNLPYIIEGVPKDKNGNTDFDTVWHDFLHGATTVALLKSTIGMFNQANVEYQKYRNNKNFDRDIKSDISSETTESLRKSLSDSFPPNEVEKFIRTLSKEEKIKVGKKGQKSSIDIELDSFMDLTIVESQKLKKVMEAPDFKLENLTREQKENVLTIHQSLHYMKDVLAERLTPEKQSSFIEATAEYYNKNLREADAPLWKNIPSKEKVFKKLQKRTTRFY